MTLMIYQLTCELATAGKSREFIYKMYKIFSVRYEYFSNGIEQIFL